MIEMRPVEGRKKDYHSGILVNGSSPYRIKGENVEVDTRKGTPKRNQSVVVGFHHV